MKVVVTGLGAVSPVGRDVESLWCAARDGRSGLRPITRFPTDGFLTNLGGEIHGAFPGDPRDWVFSFAREACRQAVEGSGLPIQNPRRVGIAMGTTLGAKGYADAFMREAVLPGGKPPRLSLYHGLAGRLADDLGLEGCCVTFDVACASSIHAVGWGFEMIRRGRMDAMIVGGTDTLSPFVFAGFHSLQALSAGVVRPFDARRDGMLIGEGSGILVLEREDLARDRRAEIRAEIRGWGFMEDATHLTAPDRTGGGMTRTIRHALDDAEMNPGEIGYVSAHGTATRYNDRMEALALRQALGEAARTIPVSSTKAVTGHCLGASAAVETLIAIRALEEQVVPPTLNHETPDPECDLDCVPNRARPHRFRSFLKLAAGFGGQNGALIASAYER